jgi:hypothetical protein
VFKEDIKDRVIKEKHINSQRKWVRMDKKKKKKRNQRRRDEKTKVKTLEK